ncbi:MAG: hypothetical protein QOH85_849 [Acidobacteriaceae bacterium]|jgi:hypothetical protein|nr:hypothetical protein [Acidobacteriaceae bacterium]
MSLEECWGAGTRTGKGWVVGHIDIAVRVQRHADRAGVLRVVVCSWLGTVYLSVIRRIDIQRKSVHNASADVPPNNPLPRSAIQMRVSDIEIGDRSAWTAIRIKRCRRGGRARLRTGQYLCLAQ